MPQTITGKLNVINEVILNPLIILMFGVALLVFFVGIFQMVANAESDDGREKGRKNVMYGIIGLFIMVSVYGIINFILNTIEVDPPSYLPLE